MQKHVRLLASCATRERVRYLRPVHNKGSRKDGPGRDSPAKLGLSVLKASAIGQCECRLAIELMAGKEALAPGCGTRRTAPVSHRGGPGDTDNSPCSGRQQRASNQTKQPTHNTNGKQNQTKQPTRNTNGKPSKLSACAEATVSIESGGKLAGAPRHHTRVPTECHRQRFKYRCS